MARSRRNLPLLGLYVLYLAALGYLTLGHQPLEELPLRLDRVMSWFADVPPSEGVSEAGAAPAGGIVTASVAAATDDLGPGRLVVVVGNVALFVPLGIIVRHEVSRSLVAALVAGALVSGSIELLQLTVATWRYPQLVDLVLNTLGAGLGWGLAQAVAGARSRR